jgi:anaerobic selenocysteine-containing dehydrogenase
MPGSARGDDQFVEIDWDQAFRILHERLAKIRSTDPKKFALFTGRDQMQALTSLFARQFGTPNTPLTVAFARSTWPRA